MDPTIDPEDLPELILDEVKFSKWSYYWWRIKMLWCFIKHDWSGEGGYARFTDTHVSGKQECARCHKERYFSRKISK